MSLGRRRPQGARGDVLASLGGIGRAYPLGPKYLINHSFLCSLSHTFIIPRRYSFLYCRLQTYSVAPWYFQIVA